MKKLFFLLSIFITTHAFAVPTIKQFESNSNIKRVYVKAVSSTDGSPVTGASLTCQIKLPDGSSFVSCAGTPTEISNGLYYVNLSSTEVDAPGYGLIKITGTGVDQFDTDFYVQQVARYALQSGKVDSVVLSSSETFLDNEIANTQLCIVSGLGLGQCRCIKEYFSNSKTAIVEPAFAVNPDNTSYYTVGDTCFIPYNDNQSSYSSNFASSIWTKSGVTVTTNSTTTHDGLTEADLITASGGGSIQHRVTADNFITTRNPQDFGYYYSVEVKAGTHDIIWMGDFASNTVQIIVDLSTLDTYLGADLKGYWIEPLASDWYRIHIYGEVLSSGIPSMKLGFASGLSSMSNVVLQLPELKHFYAARFKGTTVNKVNPEILSKMKLNLQAAASGTATLSPNNSSTDDFYNGMELCIEDGTGSGQCRCIQDYTGSTRVASLYSNWAVTPDDTSKYTLERVCSDGVAGGGGGGAAKEMQIVTVKQFEDDAALKVVPILMVDATDGVTPETGLTVTCTIREPDAGSFSSNCGTVTEKGNGIYHVALPDAAINVAGFGAINVSASGALSKQYTYKVEKVARNVAQGGSTSTIQLASSESFADDQLNGRGVCIVSGTGKEQCSCITDYASLNDTATASFAIAPDNTSYYALMSSCNSRVLSIANNSISSSSFASNAISADAMSQGAADKVWDSTTRDLTEGVTVDSITDKTGYSLAASQTFSTTGSVGSVTNGVTVATNNDKTGYKISGSKQTLDNLNDITVTQIWSQKLEDNFQANTAGHDLYSAKAATSNKMEYDFDRQIYKLFKTDETRVFQTGINKPSLRDPY